MTPEDAEPAAVYVVTVGERDAKVGDYWRDPLYGGVVCYAKLAVAVDATQRALDDVARRDHFVQRPGQGPAHVVQQWDSVGYAIRDSVGYVSRTVWLEKLDLVTRVRPL